MIWVSTITPINFLGSLGSSAIADFFKAYSLIYIADSRFHFLSSKREHICSRIMQRSPRAKNLFCTRKLRFYSHLNCLPDRFSVVNSIFFHYGKKKCARSALAAALWNPMKVSSTAAPNSEVPWAPTDSHGSNLICFREVRAKFKPRLTARPESSARFKNILPWYAPFLWKELVDVKTLHSQNSYYDWDQENSSGEGNR